MKQKDPDQTMDGATRIGAILFSSFGSLSAASTAVVMSLILHQLVTWKGNYKKLIQQNQCMVLVLNLFLADFILGFGAALGFRWVQTGKIDSSSWWCWVQAAMLQVGEIASGLFVLALAVQTLLTFMRGKPVPHLWFCIGPIVLWTFCLVLLVIGLAVHGGQFFEQTYSWCFISRKYGWERLWLHYFWVFLIEAFVLVIYFGLSIHLYLTQARIYNLKPPRALVQRLSKTIWLLALYPIIYLALSLPLAETRMEELAGHPPSPILMTVVGALLASCGWLNAIVYSLTRRVLINTLNTAPDSLCSETDIALQDMNTDADAFPPPSSHTNRSGISTPTTTKKNTPASSIHGRDMKIEARMEWKVFREMREDDAVAESCGLGWKRSGLNKQWFPS